MDRGQRRTLALLASALGLSALIAVVVLQGPAGQSTGGGSSASPTSATPASTAPGVGSSPSPAASPSATPSALPPSPTASPTPASAIVPGSVDRSSLDLSATYEVDARLDFGTRALTVETAITVRNDSGAGIDRLELNTIAVRLGDPTGLTATVDGQAAAATVDDQTIVVPLGGILPAGSSAVVRVAFGSTLRSGLSGSDWLFTRTNDVVDLYRWIPWVSVAHPFDRPNHGDPFVTPTSSLVRVRMTTDRPLVFATTGERVAADGLSQTFEARQVRDFAMTGAPDYRVTSGTVGGTTIRVFVRPGFDAASRLSWAERALARYASLLGPYPYGTFVIAQPAGGFGLEAPGFVWIPGTTAASVVPDLVTHEAAHQWFNAMVGNDQALQPFADEAVAEFLARDLLGAFRASRCTTSRLDLSIYAYSDACYYEIIYIQGGNLLNDLRLMMGDTAFWRGLRAYLAAERWRIGGTRQLLDALDAATPLDLRPTLRARFPSLY